MVILCLFFLRHYFLFYDLFVRQLVNLLIVIASLQAVLIEIHAS